MEYFDNISSPEGEDVVQSNSVSDTECGSEMDETSNAIDPNDADLFSVTEDII